MRRSASVLVFSCGLAASLPARANLADVSGGGFTALMALAVVGMIGPPMVAAWIARPRRRVLTWAIAQGVWFASCVMSMRLAAEAHSLVPVYLQFAIGLPALWGYVFLDRQDA